MTNPRNVVEFPANTPVEIILKYPTAKLFSNEHGDRAMFSLTDGRAMFLDPEVAKQIEDAGINVNQPFSITRRQNGKSKSTWEISKPLGEQKDGTFVVPRDTPAPKPIARASSLVDEANALVDAYAQVLERTLTTYQGRIKPEEARAILITTYIQRSKFSSVA